MIADAGFVVLGQEASSPAEVARRLREAAHAASAHEAQATAGGCASGCGTGCGSAASGCGPSAAREPVLRRRGAGTQQGPNA